MKGFIVLHKKLLNWEWYTDANTYRLFIHLLLKANYTDKKWRGKLIKRGQLVTSLDHLKTELQLSIQQMRTGLDKLVMTENIIKEATNNFTLITIVNYDYYQKTKKFIDKSTNKPTSTKTTIQQQSSNNQITTTKKKKENKRSNNEYKEVRSTHTFLKNDLVFWEEYLEEYKNQVFDFEMMLKKFDLKMIEDNFPFQKSNLQARLIRWTLSWIKNQQKDNNKFIPHR